MIHGNPSGVDNAVSTWGRCCLGPVFFIFSPLEILMTSVAAQALWVWGEQHQWILRKMVFSWWEGNGGRLRASHVLDPNLGRWAGAWEATVSVGPPAPGVQMVKLWNHCCGVCRPHQLGSPPVRTPAVVPPPPHRRAAHRREAGCLHVREGPQVLGAERLRALLGLCCLKLRCLVMGLSLVTVTLYPYPKPSPFPKRHRYGAFPTTLTHSFFSLGGALRYQQGKISSLNR